MYQQLHTRFSQIACSRRQWLPRILLALTLITGTGCPPERPTAASWGHNRWPTTLPAALITTTATTSSAARSTFRVAAVEVFASATRGARRPASRP